MDTERKQKEMTQENLHTPQCEQKKLTFDLKLAGAAYSYKHTDKEIYNVIQILQRTR